MSIEFLAKDLYNYLCHQLSDMAKVRRRKFLAGVSGMGIAGLSGCTGNLGGSDEYPSKDISVTINWGAGGATDAYARQVTGKAIEGLDVNASFSNINGGGGLRGTSETFHSEPDGYTVGSMAPPLVPLSALVNPPKFDMRELVPVAAYSAGTLGLWTLPKHDISSVEELTERYQNGEFSVIGTQGSGDMSDILGRLMKDDDEYDLAYEDSVSYGGSAPAAKALVSEEVPAIIATDGGVRQYYRNEQIDAIAMLHSDGSTMFSDLPSVADNDWPTWDYVARFIRGMVFPPETPTEKRDMLEEAIKDATESDEIKEWSEESGNPVNFQDHETLGNAMTEAFEKIPKEIDIDSLD